jgi:hypothetical protein
MMVHLTLGLGDKAEALLVLLVVGHVVADFLVQTPRVAERKEVETWPLLEHGLMTFVTHAVLVAPFMSWGVMAGVAALAAVHTGFDALRIKLGGAWGGSLSGFFADQSAHLASVVALWWILRSAGAHKEIVMPQAALWLPWVKRYGLVAAGYVLNGRGGTAVVRKLLARYPKVVPRAVDGEIDEYAMGRTIGCLERFIVFTLVLYGQWGALGLVVAAKSIARFPELKEKEFSDYYLIGTLASILVAIVTGVVVRALVF